MSISKSARAIVNRHQREVKTLASDGLSAMGPTLEKQKDKLKATLLKAMTRNDEGKLVWKPSSYKKVRAISKQIAGHVETHLHEALQVTTAQAQLLADRHLATKLGSRIANTGRTAVGDTAKVAKQVAPQIESVAARIGSSRGPTGIEAKIQKLISSDVLEEAEVSGTLSDVLGVSTLMDAEMIESAALDETVAAEAITEGLFEKFLGYIERALRTETVSAYQAQNQSGIEKSGTPQQMWVVDVASNVCDICESLDGQIVDVGDQFEDEDGEMYDNPPAHPNCVCDVVPYEEAPEDQQDQDQTELVFPNAEEQEEPPPEVG